MPREDPFGWVGHVLDDKYRIDSVVGEGGFGVVYRAHHLGFEQAVAVKCLKVNKNLEGAAHDAFLNNSFRRAASSTACRARPRTSCKRSTLVWRPRRR